MDNVASDPIVLYVIIREGLKMSAGKTAAQVGHAVQNILLKYFKMQILSVKKDLHIFSDDDLKSIKTTTHWLEHASTKVILRADESEWRKLKEEFHKDMVLIIDAGLTEIAASSETCISLFPMHKSECPKLIRRLRLL